MKHTNHRNGVAPSETGGDIATLQEIRRNELKRMSKSELVHEIELIDAELTRRGGLLMKLVWALRDCLEMLDASAFGGHKSYRCLTEKEAARLTEVRHLIAGWNL